MEIWETHGETYSENDIPSGKHTKTYGKIHHFQWVNPLFLWSFSIAMLNYQRVLSCFIIHIYAGEKKTRGLTGIKTAKLGLNLHKNRGFARKDGRLKSKQSHSLQYTLWLFNIAMEHGP